jgi:hypothetical protein
VSPFPNILETEPNNDISVPNVATGETPFALNGVIEQKGDVDCFKFTAKKGMDYDVTVWARRLRSPLDSVFDIYDLKGIVSPGTMTQETSIVTCAGRRQPTASLSFPFMISSSAADRLLRIASR